MKASFSESVHCVPGYRCWAAWKSSTARSTTYSEDAPPSNWMSSHRVRMGMPMMNPYGSDCKYESAIIDDGMIIVRASELTCTLAGHVGAVKFIFYWPSSQNTQKGGILACCHRNKWMTDWFVNEEICSNCKYCMYWTYCHRMFTDVWQYFLQRQYFHLQTRRTQTVRCKDVQNNLMSVSVGGDEMLFDWVIS